MLIQVLTVVSLKLPSGYMNCTYILELFFNGGHLLFEFLLVFKRELGCTFESLHAKVCLGTTESEKLSSFRYY